MYWDDSHSKVHILALFSENAYQTAFEVITSLGIYALKLGLQKGTFEALTTAIFPTSSLTQPEKSDKQDNRDVPESRLGVAVDVADRAVRQGEFLYQGEQFWKDYVQKTVQDESIRKLILQLLSDHECDITPQNTKASSCEQTD